MVCWKVLRPMAAKVSAARVVLQKSSAGRERSPALIGIASIGTSSKGFALGEGRLLLQDTHGRRVAETK